jgi:hypothetical protein
MECFIMTTQIKGNDTSTFGGNVDLGANNLTTTGTLPAPDALSTASGSAPSYSARAWVNFNGTGTVAIRASGNVSSITDNGAGLYAVNFTTNMPDADYSVTTAIGWNGSSVSSNSVAMIRDNLVAPSVNSFHLATAFASTGTAYDVEKIYVAIFR